MANCLFCSIISGDIPSAKIYENDKVYAFLDIAPLKKGHTLIIPKYHCETVLDLPLEYAHDVIEAQQLIAKALMDSLGATGFNCIQNNFESSGQVVYHVHWHIIPRFDRSEFPSMKQGSYEDMDEMLEFAKKISTSL